MRTLSSLLVSLVVLTAGAPTTAAGQGFLAGVVGGRAESRLLRDRFADSEPWAGPVAGGWVEVQAPSRLLHVLAEATWTRRGGGYPDTPGAVGGNAVRSDHLTFLVAPTLRAGVGAVSVLTYGGPSLQLHLRTRAGSEVAHLFRDASAQAFGFAVGAGVAVALGGWEVRGEARRVEGLSRAYAFDDGDFLHRATEVLVRVGRRGLR